MSPAGGRSLRLVHYGLGAIGIEVARLARSRSGLVSVGAVDIDPALAGRRLAEALGEDAEAEPGSEVTIAGDNSVLSCTQADVALHCTGSSAERVKDQLLALLRVGLKVITTCEELSFPWEEAGAIARELDQEAKRNGVTLLGTGVNPGFAMDYLPIALSAVMRRVEHVRVHRVQDAASRRLPLQAKVGARLTPQEFELGVREGQVRHVGLMQSAQALAAAFGWSLGRVEESIRPLLAQRATASGRGTVPTGRVIGLHQTLHAWAGEQQVVELVLDMALGLPEPRDEISMLGDPDLHLVVPGGLPGDAATAAIVVNSIPLVVEAQPGLLTMAQLAPPRPWS